MRAIEDVKMEAAEDLGLALERAKDGNVLGYAVLTIDHTGAHKFSYGAAGELYFAALLGKLNALRHSMECHFEEVEDDGGKDEPEPA